MRRDEAFETLSALLKAGVDCAITGEAQSGKTTLARALAPEAPIIHGFELAGEYLGAIGSRLFDARVAIVENAAQESVKLLEPLLATRTILGKAFDCRFIVTARQELALKGCAAIKLSAIDAKEWLKWAEQTRAHPALIALVQSDPTFLSRRDLRTIEALSKVLSARPSAKTLDKTLGAMLGDDKDAIAALTESMSAPISSPENAFV
ncbi:MAG: hypothetical protein LBC09_05240, partial [Helicobacteraceae bacterium]|nr:hypothetical protein [Helicobacteraceae bacterium]